VASSAAPGEHNYFYEIDRISKARNGELAFELTHFPVDDQGRSLVALDVMAATASGVMLPTGFNAATISCDVNSASDTTLAPDVGFDGPDYNDAGMGDMSDYDDGDMGGGGISAPIATPDPMDSSVNRTPEIAPEASVGDVLTAPDCECETSSIQWYRGTAFGDNPTPIPSATGGTYKVGVIDGGTGVFAVITCTDGSACTSKPVPIRGWKIGADERNDLGAEMQISWSVTITSGLNQSGCPSYPGANCESTNNIYSRVNEYGYGRFVSINIIGNPSYSSGCGSGGYASQSVELRFYDASGNLQPGGYDFGQSELKDYVCSGSAYVNVGAFTFKRVDGTPIEPPLPAV
jgi:hypothetical protein